MPELLKPTKSDIKQLIGSSKDALTFWVETIILEKSSKAGTTSSAPAVSEIQTARLDSPLEELVKLASLVHARVTKLGIVFKPLIPEENYHACYKELDEGMHSMILLVSVSKQLQQEEQKYSFVFVEELLNCIKIVLTGYMGCLNELENAIDAENQGQSQRLVSVGKVWEACSDLQRQVQQGSSGLLKAKLKQTNQLINDASKEYNDWIANPTAEDQDFNDFANFDDLHNSKSLHNETEVDTTLIEFAKRWNGKIKMIKLLIMTLNKSIPDAKYNIKFSKTIDLLNSKSFKLSEKVDDLVASVIYDQDVEEAKSAGKELIEEATQAALLVRTMNEGNSTRTRWLDTWSKKFVE
ncbi:hypothetical protein FOA43_003740 [Brettanomyces nanus]|uniref:Cyclin-D1-binding protein 1-like N-terminal domain-containing protein n=1 Tax=Eeniella nana TaxID=13502 RepID=A0A875S909_EENNA|nr:uncharacterized protein FOA43_003740 [Brettanomyces nanus]QPG76352.1 hypothetical protein FOA43_003740 [Brettanomyces nanus]